MPVTVHIGGRLTAFTKGVAETRLDTPPATVGEMLNSLWEFHPALRERVLDEQGDIRQHVNIFVGGKDVRRLDGLSTRVEAGELHIFNAVSGG